MISAATCSRCGDHEKSFLHCVQDCSFSIIIWQRIGFSSQAFFFTNSVTEWLKEGSNCSRSIAFFPALWWLWKHRNHMCLSNETMFVTRLICNIFGQAETMFATRLICNIFGLAETISASFFNSAGHPKGRMHL